MARKRTSKTNPICTIINNSKISSPKITREIRDENHDKLQQAIEEFDLTKARSINNLSSSILSYERYTSITYNQITKYELDQSLLGMGKHLLTKWRKTLKSKNPIFVSAPDYDDEYENDNDVYKWTKLFKAEIINFSHEVGDVIQLGDSSLESKIEYTLQEDESAVLVHYDGFPEWQKQWFMTYDDRVVPLDSHLDVVKVLKDIEEVNTHEEENVEMERKEVETKVKTKKKTDVGSAEDDYVSWICAECREAEYNSNPEIPLLICEGSCNRAFHYPCAGLKKLPSSDKKWICNDCKQKKHPCHICTLHDADDELVYCSVSNCGLYYHASCLSTEYGIDVEDGKKFRCPAHECWCCNDGSDFGLGAGRLYKCMECPNSYHLKCIPPKAKFHELALLCHKHSHLKLPDLDINTSVQNKVETKMIEIEQKALNQKNKKRKLVLSESKYFLRDPEHWKDKSNYALPLNFLQEVYSKPPPYKHISVNRYNPSNRPTRLPPSDNTHCNCIPANGSCLEQNCINHHLYIECIGPTCSFNKEYVNCDNTEDCGNRRLRFRQVAKVRPKREPSKGWGLKTLQAIWKGDLVQEYVGEVIHEEVMLSRLNNWAKEHPYNQDYYIMKMMGDWYIDARYMGNLSRFMNHSCEPNCHLVPFNVGGYMRIAIIALKDIQVGEYLTYSYRFESTDLPGKFTCRCGAPSCTGTFQNNNSKKVKKCPQESTSKTAIRQYENDVKFLQKVNCPSRFKRLNSTALTVPEGEEIVGNGPCLKYKAHARKHNIFLWRSAVIGGRFDDRLNGWERKRDKAFVMPEKKDVDMIKIISKYNDS